MSRPVGYRFPIAARFWSKVRKTSTCWMWVGSCDTCGYGSFQYDGRMQGAHRVSWLLHKGAIPVGMKVLHKCDNPPCVNPAHLFLGTDQSNTDDKMKKGRHVPCLGEQHGMVKLTESDVRQIRHRRRLGESLVTVASDFGTTFSNVSMICLGRTWRHI